ncbi:MAG: acyltransferase [Deltaproteobacteria bacterium]|nr:acyltransferase [Deltaproteobacteria bacterium]
MRSSSGEHFIALDHVRALAAFMVFSWHFTHADSGYPVPFEYTPSFFIFSLLDEGHTGVALFMTLSGYLFAKLLDGKRIDYKAFFWNRFLRLAPLLMVVIILVGLKKIFDGSPLYPYARSIAQGVWLPSLPNGGWSITIEFHFYLMLPFFLWFSRKSKPSLLLIILSALMLRFLLHHERGQIQSLAYWTIIGRIDQFLFGMLAFQYRNLMANRSVMAIGSLTAFCLFYWYFDLQGGFYQHPSYPSPSLIWIFLPTLEAMAYASVIAYYDNSFSPPNKGISRFIGQIGAFSYSIYLLHFFVVFRMARFINDKLMDISNFYLCCLCALICFMLMTPVGYISFRFIEAPFLKLRRRYTIENIRQAREGQECSALSTETLAP